MPVQYPDFGRISFEEANPWLKGAAYGQDMTRNYMMFPQEMQKIMMANQKSAAELPYAGQLAKSTAAYKEAMANYLSSPNQALKNLSPVGKTYVEPNVVDAILKSRGIRNRQPGQGFEYNESGGESGGNQQDINDIYKLERNKITRDPVLQRNAQSSQIIYNEINDIDTKPLEKFAGLGGRLNLWKEQGKGALSSMGFDVKPSDDFREYNAYMSVHKNAIMDAIRKALATSVVPEYVGQTLMPMVDPASPIWNDPEQVRKNIESLKEWIKPYAGEATEAMAKGVPSSLEESSSRHQKFVNKEESKGSKLLSNDIEIPEFSTREEGIAWFKRQPSVVQSAIRRKLRVK